jgi:membrane fusion protein, copper/silver efflux system
VQPGATPATPKVKPATRNAYVCPMPEHVSIIYDHPGKCPICSMALVPVQAAGTAPR